MARLLWVACDQPGSLFPAVPLVQEIIRRGHEIDAVGTAAARATFVGLGCGFLPTTHLDRYLAATVTGRDVAEKRRWHAGRVAALFADVWAHLAARRFDAVLADPLEVGGGFAAEAADLPWVSYVHFRMEETGLDVPFEHHFRHPEEPPVEGFVAWWNQLRAAVGLGPEARPAEEHPWYRHSPWSTVILGLPELVHLTGPLPPYALRVGPSVWQPPSKAPPPSWLDRLGQDRPALLASVSTVGQADTGPLNALARAAEDAGLDVVATLPRDDAVPRLPPSVIRTGFLGHDLLVDKVALVASHAGNGTVTRAACAGVPQLLMLTGRDQFAVARGAVHAGVAVTSAPADATPDTLHAALVELSTDHRYTEQARHIATAATRYDAPGATAEAVHRLLHAGQPPRATATRPTTPTA